MSWNTRGMNSPVPGGSIAKVSSKPLTDYTLDESGYIRPKLGEDYKLSAKKTYEAVYDQNGYAVLREAANDMHLSKKAQEEFTKWTPILSKLLFSMAQDLKNPNPRVLGCLLHGGIGAYKTTFMKKILTMANVPIIQPDKRMQWYDLDRLISTSTSEAIGILLDECNKYQMDNDEFIEFMDSTAQTKLKIVLATTNDFNKLNLPKQHIGRPSRWRNIIRVPDVDINESILRHIKKICPEFIAVKALATFIERYVKEPNEDGIQTIIDELMKWDLHTHKILHDDKLLEIIGLINIQLTVDPEKYRTPASMAQFDIMQKTPVELVEALVQRNRSLDKKREMDDLRKHVEGYVDKKRPKANWLN